MFSIIFNIGSSRSWIDFPVSHVIHNVTLFQVAHNQSGEKINMQKTSFKGWKNCVELNSGDFKIVVTTEIGPRIIGGFVGKSENIFYVDPASAGKKGGSEWKLYGGHRLWHSPEAKPRRYWPDNGPVQVKEKKAGIEFTAGVEPTTGIYKSMTIKPLGKRKFSVSHMLRNENTWPVELAAWALSVMAPGGTAVIPVPQGDRKALLPNCYMTVWPYTDLGDSRLSFGRKLILLRQDPNAKEASKIGLNCEDGWIAYANNGVALVKRFEHMVDAEYPDNGCSIESYSCSFMLEIETLGPLYLLEPGAELVHEEVWEGVTGIGKIDTEKDAAKYFR